MFFAIPIVAVFPAFMALGAQLNPATEESSSSNAGKPNEKKSLSLSGTKTILVAYFSHSGNTRDVANQIHEIAGGDIFEIQAIETYPENYEEVKKRAEQELASGFKPALKTKINDIKSYDFVFIGYPVWWGTFPAPIRTFLSEYDFSGKTIVPFCTHAGSGLGRSVTDISKLCPKSTLLDGVAIWGRDSRTAQSNVSEWLQKIKTTK
jgi:flavodoxin